MSSISPVSAAPSPFPQRAAQVARPTAPPQAAVDPDHDGDHDTPGRIDVKA